jgi:DNA polymerase-3 subunit beta
MIFIKATREAILKPLQTVAGIVERRHTMPILANILIQTDGDQATFLASDNQIQIQTRAAIACSPEPVALTVNARKLIDILRSLPDREIRLSWHQNKLSIAAGKSHFALQTLPAADFPSMANLEEVAVELTMPQTQLANLFAMVHFAMAQQDVRYYLTGLLMVVNAPAVRAVTTDGHRLAYKALDLDGLPAETQHEVILPRKTVNELQRLLTDAEQGVTVAMSSRQIRFRFGDVELVSKLVEGRFPDYVRVIPTHYTRQITVDRELLFANLSRSAILTTEKFKGIRLVLSPGVLKIITQNFEQEEAIEELDVDYQDLELDMGFNVSYLLDVLSNIKHPTVRLEFGTAESSLLMGVPDDPGFKYVVMPMRV